MRFKHRIATMEDLPRMKELMHSSIEELQKGFLAPEQIEASKHVMGLDTLLVRDGTYFVIEEESEMAGCGGWSRRRTLFGGDHTSGRDPELLDPKVDAARVRAMYTNPAFVRRGVGSIILQLCEQAAKAEGFSKLELAGTMAGIPLYEHYGFVVVKRWMEETPTGISVPLAKMEKMI